MQKALQSFLFVALMGCLAWGCQPKKKQEATTQVNDTTTLVESATVLAGPDSGAVVTETDKVIVPDSTRK